MFTKKLTISRVFERIAALRDNARANGYCCFDYHDRFRYQGETTNTFRTNPYGVGIRDKWSDELRFLHTMRKQYGVSGKNTLLVFEGVDHPDINKALDACNRAIGIRSIDIKIKAHETDTSQHEHFLFLGFEDRERLLAFTSTFGRKTVEEVLEQEVQEKTFDQMDEFDLLSGIGDLIDA